jgi:ABC-type iron transport system FetAB permease component
MTCLYQQVNKILLERAFASASVMKVFTVLVTMKYVMEHVIELKSLLLLLLMLASRLQVSGAEALSVPTRLLPEAAAPPKPR